MELAPAITGLVTLRIGEREWRGTVDEARGGTHMERASVLLVGGAGSWGKSLRAKHYHSDAGVRARLVIEDAARESGETVNIAAEVGDVALGIDYVRTAGPASRALEDALQGAVWWVDAVGVTQVAASRPEADVEPSVYEVLEYDPRSSIAVVSVDDVAAVSVGSRLATRLDAVQVVRELEITVEPAAIRLRARCAPAADALATLFRKAVQTVTGSRLWGSWRYRVTRISGDRLELQAVSAQSGLPDVLPISVWPGVAGSHAKPALGAEVLVEFIEGDRTQPHVRAFAGKGGVGHIPEEHTLSVSSMLYAGGAAASSFAAKADAVLDRLQAIVTGFNTHIHSGGTISGSTGVPAVTLSTPVASVACSKVKVE
jgi:hypothetical protein